MSAPPGPVRGLAIVGSTGSIGTAALDVATRPEMVHKLRVVALAAGHNIERVAAQVRQHRPRLVSVSEEHDRRRLTDLLGEAAKRVEILHGEQGARAVATHPRADVVLCAMAGARGLTPTLAAIRRGMPTVAIANKEALVLAGAICVQEARAHGVRIVPVDSEHNALFQLVEAHLPEQAPDEPRRVVLTGSGGPLRDVADLSSVTPSQALAHPTWSMGPKITVDSSTLMNKGLEVIEAHALFDLEPHQIEVLIHPQSVVHAMIERSDGSVVAHMGAPDMRIPIAHALSYPALPRTAPARLDLCRLGSLTFEQPDLTRFPCLGLAYEALASGATYPAALNAANEVAVEAFLGGRLRFVEIPSLIRRCLDAHEPIEPSLESLLAVDRWARSATSRWLA